MGYGTIDQNDIVFPKLGIELEVNPEAISIGGVSIQWYGILIAIGALLALFFAFKNLKKVGLSPDRAIDSIIGGVIGGVIGARLYYVLLEWDEYKDNLIDIINIRKGGLGIYGGVIGGILVALIICKIRKVKILPLLDLAGMGFLIGQGIGRWGNFCNQEAFGCNTDLPWGMSGGRIKEWIIYKNTYAPESISLPNGEILSEQFPVHPCFLYESIWCIIGFFVLLFFFKRIKFDGQIALMYAGWYGLGRFFIEGLRTDSLMVGNIRASQIVAILGVMASIILLLLMFSKVKRSGGEYVLYRDTEESKALILEDEQKALSKNKKAIKAEDVADSDTVEEIEDNTVENSEEDNDDGEDN